MEKADSVEKDEGAEGAGGEEEADAEGEVRLPMLIKLLEQVDFI